MKIGAPIGLKTFCPELCGDICVGVVCPFPHNPFFEPGDVCHCFRPRARRPLCYGVHGASRVLRQPQVGKANTRHTA